MVFDEFRIQGEETGGFGVLGLVHIFVIILAMLRLAILDVRPVVAESRRNMLVIVVVDDVVLVLANDSHSREDVECVVDTSLHVLEVDLLPDLIPISKC